CRDQQTHHGGPAQPVECPRHRNHGKALAVIHEKLESSKTAKPPAPKNASRALSIFYPPSSIFGRFSSLVLPLPVSRSISRSCCNSRALGRRDLSRLATN